MGRPGGTREECVRNTLGEVWAGAEGKSGGGRGELVAPRGPSGKLVCGGGRKDDGSCGRGVGEGRRGRERIGLARPCSRLMNAIIAGILSNSDCSVREFQSSFMITGSLSGVVVAVLVGGDILLEVKVKVNLYASWNLFEECWS
jgi:hypothetical protein